MNSDDRETKADRAYHLLRDRVLTGALKPSQPLDQTQLADDLGISRMPLRQALSRLSAEGLVEAKPHRTARVAALRRRDMEGLYLARREIEGLLAEASLPQLGCEVITSLHDLLGQQEAALDAHDLDRFGSLDNAFHGLLYEQANYPPVLEVWRILRTASERYVTLFTAHHERARESYQEHARILRFAEAEGATLLRHAVTHHVMRGFETLQSIADGGGDGDTRRVGTLDDEERGETQDDSNKSRS